MKAPVLLSGFLVAVVLEAHPMGNFSVNHYTRLEVSAHRVAVTYALDLAEIPTFELLQQWKLDADLVVLSGPPFELSTRVLAVMIDGQWVYQEEDEP